MSFFLKPDSLLRILMKKKFPTKLCKLTKMVPSDVVPSAMFMFFSVSKPDEGIKKVVVQDPCVFHFRCCLECAANKLK